MRSISMTITLAAAIAGAAFAAACGGPPPPEVPPPAPSASAPTTPTPPATSAAAAPTPAPTPSETTPPPPATTQAPPTKQMPEVKASALADDLKGIGLDITKLPAIGKLTGQQRSKVMPILKKATGFDCGDCHAGTDFKKDTPTKQVARKMWDEYVAPTKLASGPVFCDSCHNGQHGFLDRGNKDAVRAYMDAQFVKKLQRKDGKEEKCQSCHGEDFDMNIFEKVWKIKDAPHK